MDQETITEAPGNDSGADTNIGILSEADLASSFLERVDEQLEIVPFRIFQSVFSEKNLTAIVTFCKFCINRNKRNDRLNACSTKIHSSLG